MGEGSTVPVAQNHTAADSLPGWCDKSGSLLVRQFEYIPVPVIRNEYRLLEWNVAIVGDSTFDGDHIGAIDESGAASTPGTEQNEQY